MLPAALDIALSRNAIRIFRIKGRIHVYGRSQESLVLRGNWTRWIRTRASRPCPRMRAFPIPISLPRIHLGLAQHEGTWGAHPIGPNHPTRRNDINARDE
ncbi:hypothetical protein B0T13DRAFT_473978 [Neurospora crassa]|nr:hypothetical protein B0T13DRAFT_473978 [Neurospora crassa]